MVRRSVLADDSRTVKAHHDRQPLQRDIMDDAVVGTLHERRVDIAERHLARRSQSRRERYGVGFGDADVEAAFGHFSHHDIHRTARRHSGRDADHAVVHTCEVEQRLSEYVLIAVEFRSARRDAFARLGIESARGVPHRKVLLRRTVAVSLLRNYVEQFRFLYVFQRSESTYQPYHVVSVHATEIAESETLEKVAVLQQTVFHGVARLAAHVEQMRSPRQSRPHALFEAVVAFGSREPQQISVQRARRLVDRHVVIVQYDENIGILARARIVHSLERQTARSSSRRR